MGGIEVLLATVMFILGMVGLVRGPAKELGVTMALVVLLAVMSQFDNLVTLDELPGRVNRIVAGVGLGSDVLVKQQMTVLFLFSAAVIMTAFLAYHGQETLAFHFKGPPGVLRVVTGWLVGALNGYLAFGTIWYYMHQLKYPVQQYEWFSANLTSLGAKLVNYLPQNLVSGVLLSGLALILLWWRILK